ncbi:hypothetical protein EDB89DRAFT_108369 [Lactarius sanguifluus]|nr:hypothetical protein EDB89DRAFT_108369 [Lactarius sanguifluus]
MSGPRLARGLLATYLAAEPPPGSDSSACTTTTNSSPPTNPDDLHDTSLDLDFEAGPTDADADAYGSRTTSSPPPPPPLALLRVGTHDHPHGVDSAACKFRARRTKATRKGKTSWACCLRTRAATTLCRRRDWARVERSLWTGSSSHLRALLLPLVRGCGGRPGARNLQTKSLGKTTTATTKAMMTMVRARNICACFYKSPSQETHPSIVIIRRAPEGANVLPLL